MALEVYRYRIEGVSSLLQHNPRVMAEPSGGSATGPKKIPAPEEEAEKATYRDEEGNLYAPSMWFRASILHGCGGRRIGKTSAKTVISGSVFNMDSRTPLVRPHTDECVDTYAIHTARVMVQNQGILRSRPEIEPWAANLRLEVDTEFVSPEIVEELLNVSGRISGVGDWRPQKKGPHGRYSATLLGVDEEFATAAMTDKTSPNGHN